MVYGARRLAPTAGTNKSKLKLVSDFSGPSLQESRGSDSNVTWPTRCPLIWATPRITQHCIAEVIGYDTVKRCPIFVTLNIQTTTTGMVHHATRLCGL